jgi:hypothetical protein
VDLADYFQHYNGHRPHRTLKQRALQPAGDSPVAVRHLDLTKPRRADPLGGFIHEYRLVA